MIRAAAILALGALAVGCREPAPPVRIRQLLVDGALGSDGVDLDKTQVRDALQRELLRARRLRLDPAAEGGVLRARAVAGRVPPDASGRPLAVLQLELEARQPAGKTLRLEAEAEARSASVIDRADDVLAQAAQQAIASLDQQLALGEQSTAQLVATLRGSDRALRLRALSLLAERRDATAYDALAAALEDADSTIALRAVGALVALGDPRAVSALTDLTHRKSAALVRQIVYAVGAIGGREAEAYLFTVASGHPDAEVQRAAQEMLKEMAARGAAPIDAPKETP